MLGDDGLLTHDDEGIVDVAISVWAEESETAGAFYTLLKDIPETNAGYTREIVARSYYVANGETVYADAVSRNVLSVATALLAKGDTNDVLSNIVDACEIDLSISKTALDMVAGGKETLTVATTPADLSVVWESNNTAVATVKGGVVTAVANGTATISAKIGNEVKECTVTVADYVQGDVSEFSYTMQEPTVDYFNKYEGAMEGRTGVYEYKNTGSAEWNNKIAPACAFHYNSGVGGDGPARVQALRTFKDKYNVMTYDLLLKDGARVQVGALSSDTAFAAEELKVGNAITENNANIMIYANGALATKAVADVWYTVVVDLTNINVAEFSKKASAYSRIDIAGILGTFYLDDVKYYGDDSWKEDVAKEYSKYDGSEIVVAAPWADGSYELSNETIGGRTGVYKYTSTAADWKDKISIRQSNHLGTKYNADETATRANMKAKNINYVAFDVCMVSGGIVICAPETGATGVGQKNDKLYTTYITSGTDLIKFYTVSNGVYTEVTSGLTANTWYTVVVEYDHDATGTYAGIDIASIAANTVAYFDNVRYYSANPVA
ncbi:MAG: Ig-like domain-containing protein [Clostridiales bacterium]|nr:Ig-like domain-containing protein [Clostridiales bacterium]